MVCNDLNQWSFYLEMGREIKNQSTSDWLVGVKVNFPPRISGRRDLNPRPFPWQGNVLPLYYSRERVLLYSVRYACQISITRWV